MQRGGDGKAGPVRGHDAADDGIGSPMARPDAVSGNARLGGSGRRWAVAWAVALVVVIGVGAGGRWLGAPGGSAEAGRGGPAAPASAGANTAASALPATGPGGDAASAGPATRPLPLPADPAAAAAIITGRPHASIPLLVLDLAAAGGRYGEAAVMATVRVFGTVRGPRPASVTVHLVDMAGADLGGSTIAIAAEGRFDGELRYRPPAGDRHVTVVIRAAPDGSLLSSTRVLVPLRGDIAVWSPARLDGWRRGEGLPVEVLVAGAAPVDLRLVDDAGSVWARGVALPVGTEGPWTRVRAELTIPAGVPPGRLWLEVDARAPAGGTTTARLLLDVGA